ncbi:MAG: hypothetical protein QOG15_3270 [Solirubrobacteraceae bacterium]|jgi:hypothetical protein|nr:hypothetical protein [Solirubrobacteraceae bacterium]
MEAQGAATTEGPPAPRLRPLSFGEILDVAIKLCVSNGATLLKAVVFVVLPVQVVSTIITISTGGADFDVFGDTNAGGHSAHETNVYVAGQVGAALLQTIAVVLATGACFRAIARAYLAEKPDWRESLRFAVKRFPQILWIGVIYIATFALAVVVIAVPMALAGTVASFVVGGIVLFVLFVWLYIVWSLAVPALMVEDVRGVKALRRSQSLVTGRWWQTFAVIMLGFLLASVLSSVIQAIFVGVILVGVDTSSLLAWVIIGLAGLVSLMITTPFQAALLLVVYFDLRVRKEGFDLELLAERFGSTGRLQATPVPAATPQPSGIPGYEPPAAPGTPYWPAPEGPRGTPPPRPDPGPPPPGWAPPSTDS